MNQVFRASCATALAVAVAAGMGLASSAGHPAAPAAKGHDGHAHAPSAAPVPAAHQPQAGGHAPANTGVLPDDAIRRLADGNARFAAGAPERPNQSVARRCETFADGQHPFAAVLACADSRVPVELVFDAGIGDLFVVRVAGNVADTDEVGTLEYGVEHLGINAVVVLGHKKCGAVTAVVDHAHVTPNIEKLVDNIAPAAEAARRAFPQLTGPRLVDKAVRANVHQAAADMLARSDLLRERVKAGKLKIVGGVYDLHTGEVDWLEPVTAAVIPAVAGPKGALAEPTQAPAHGHGGGGAHGAGEPATGHGRSAGGSVYGDEAQSADGAPDTRAAGKTKKDNYVALGGFLGGGAALSFAVMHFLKGRQPAAASTAGQA